jgi:DNA-binding transcriptional ArsR family regulator
MERAGRDELWAAVADPTRRRLLDVLLARGEASATALTAELPVTRQGIAKHLAVLDRAGLVEVGESAGPTISLPADVLRSSGLELVGSGAGTIPVEEIMKALPEVIERAARGDLRADPEVVPISEIEAAWTRGDRLGRRIVIVP